MTPIRRPLLPAAVLAMATLLVYLPVVGHPFFQMDDQEYVTGNPMVRDGLAPAGIRWAFTSVGYAANWHPLTWISHMVDVSLFGLTSAGHHLSSAAIHALSAALLFIALQAMTGAGVAAFAAAALFALHPQRVESVVWIAERKDVLCGLFVQVSLLLYLAWLRRPSPGRHAMVSLGIFAAMASKPMAVTLPFCLLLLDWWPLGRLRRGNVGRVILEKVPWFALAAGASWLTWTAQSSKGAVTRLVYIGVGERLGAACASYVRYFGLFLWPSRLGFTYSHPVGGYPIWGTLGNAVLLITLTLIVLRGWRRGFPPVAWFWFLGTLVPVIGLVQVGGQAAADRYTYLPSVGLAMLAAWLGLGGGLAARRRVAALSAAGVVLAAMTLLTSFQISLWRDGKEILERTAAAEPDNLTVQLILAQIMRSRGEDDAAMMHFSEALRLIPVLGEAHAGMGEILLRRGEAARAVEHFAMAVKADPADGQAHFNLGVALEANRMPAEALGEYRLAVDLDPSSVAHWGKLALGQSLAGLVWEAEATYRKAAGRFPGSVEIRNNWGIFLAGIGDLDGAERVFREALATDPACSTAAENLDILMRRRNSEAGR